MTAFASLVDTTAFLSFTEDGPMVLDDSESPIALIAVIARVDGVSADHFTLSVTRAYYMPAGDEDEEVHAEWLEYDEDSPLELVVPASVVTGGYEVSEEEEED